MAETTSKGAATNFEALRVGLASPDIIKSWSRGEVKKPETINYRTFRPERDGLFCEKIFGPTKDYECYCGKYKKHKFRGIICDKCGVEVTTSRVRRRRMGHIELAAPVAHIWYLKGVPSPIALLLDVSARDLEKVVYFGASIVTHLDREALNAIFPQLSAAVDEEVEKLKGLLEQREQRMLEEMENFLSVREDLEGEDFAELANVVDAEDAGLIEAEVVVDEEAEEEEEEELDLHEEPVAVLPRSVDEEDEDEDSPMLGEEEGVFDTSVDDFFGSLSQDDLLDDDTVREETSKRLDDERRETEEEIDGLRDGLELLAEIQLKDLLNEEDVRKLDSVLDVITERLDRDPEALFCAKMGAEALLDLLHEVDLESLSRELDKDVDETSGAKRVRAIKRLQLVNSLRDSRNRPEWMIMTVMPVMPPDLRPMVQLDGGRFASSDLNDLYRRIINRNNRLKRIIEIRAPRSIVNHEKRLLQEAVDALIDNSRRSRPVTGPNKRALKSLSDMLKGKEGRFRKNLLGKRVDYSGRSVIVVGPHLKLHQCGLPKDMALELFKPFVIKKLVEQNFTTNIKTAKRMIDRGQPEVWDALEEIIEDHPVLLNRAPTLHRLGIQAFEPQLVEGKAIQVHPLVCHGYNADFDGDQMAVHVPLGADAQAEARILMQARENMFGPAGGAPEAAPLYDIVLGCYYITQESQRQKDKPKLMSSTEEAVLAYELGHLDVHEFVQCPIEEIEISFKDGRKKFAPRREAFWSIQRAGTELFEQGLLRVGEEYEITVDPKSEPTEYEALGIYGKVSEMADEVRLALTTEVSSELVKADPVKLVGQTLADDYKDAEGETVFVSGTVLDEETAPKLVELVGSRKKVSVRRTTQAYNEEQHRSERCRLKLQRTIDELFRKELLPEKGKANIKLVTQPQVTTTGRVLFNRLLPLCLRFKDKPADKKLLSDLTKECHSIFGVPRTAAMLDDIKDAGLKFATTAGLSISMADMSIASERDEIIERTQKEVDKINRDYRRRIISDGERQLRVLNLWLKARNQVADDIMQKVSKFNPLYLMLSSGARGNKNQLTQLAGMRGLMSDPRGNFIEDLPVKSNFHEGLGLLEYFVSTHGARKGVADTALRTADAGYLTRKLVDVAQDVMVREHDCGTVNGFTVEPIFEEDVHCSQCGTLDLKRISNEEGHIICQSCGADLGEHDDDKIEELEERLFGCVAAEDIVHPETGEVLVERNKIIWEDDVKVVVDSGLVQVKVRSPLTCETTAGVCTLCYGLDLSRRQLVREGEAVGIVAAESIGEPGTQLTLRTFHTGGVAEQYITGVADVRGRVQQILRQIREDMEETSAGTNREQRSTYQRVVKVLENPVGGLLRIIELFEARKPKGQAIICDLDGFIEDIVPAGAYRTVTLRSILEVAPELSELAKGERLCEDAVSPVNGKTIMKVGDKLTDSNIFSLITAGVKNVTIRKEYIVPFRGKLQVVKGEKVSAGTRITQGPLEPRMLLKLRGLDGVRAYLVREIQAVYRSYNIRINDKHLECVIRQMLKKRKVVERGGTRFLPGERLDQWVLEGENQSMREQGLHEATAEFQLMGITDAALASDSFLSAASFQKTTKVLTDAALAARRDTLEGLKENVIIGRLIPAGTGGKQYKGIKTRRADGVEEIPADLLREPLVETSELEELEKLMVGATGSEEIAREVLGEGFEGDDGEELDLDALGLKALDEDELPENEADDLLGEFHAVAEEEEEELDLELGASGETEEEEPEQEEGLIEE